MTDPDFLADVLAGLSENPRRLPGKYLWDEAGSILFDRICDSPDYYPTQCEMALIPRVAPIVAERVGSGATIVAMRKPGARHFAKLVM